jgi:hypothetical protein
MAQENLHPGATARRHRRTTYVTVRKFDAKRGIAYGQVVIDTHHDGRPTGAYPVESFVARPGDADYHAGAWVLGVQLTPELTEQVEKGELNGFSFQAIVRPVEVDVEVTILRDRVGMTKAAEGHRHAFLLLFHEEGQIAKGWTDEVNGHRHVILRGSVTQAEAGHAHRYFM